MNDNELKLQDIPGYEGVANDPIVDLTETNNNMEATMATKYETHEVNGVTCVGKIEAMHIIGLKYSTEFKKYVDLKKVTYVGDVQVQGKTTKKMYSLESVEKARDSHTTRGSDAAERYEIEIHGDVMAAALADIIMNKKSPHVEALIKALQGATNLTEKRRAYNKAKKA